MPLNEAQKKYIRFVLEDFIDTLFPDDEKEKKKTSRPATTLHLLNLITFVVICSKANDMMVDYLNDPAKFNDSHKEDMPKVTLTLETLFADAVSHILPYFKKLKHEKWDLKKFMERDLSVSQLGNSLYFPQRYLAGIEAHNTHISVYDVQAFVFMMIRERLEAHYPKHADVFDHVALDRYIGTNISKFTSLKSRTESGENPNLLKHVKNKIFSGIFTFEPTNEFSLAEFNTHKYIEIFIYIEVKLGERLSSKKHLLDRKIAPVFNNDVEDNNYQMAILTELQPLARKACEQFAIEEIQFCFNYSIPDDINLEQRQRLFDLVTTSFYFELLMKKKLRWANFLEMTRKSTQHSEAYANERIALFTHPDTIEFLRTNPFNFTVKNLLKLSNAEIQNICHPAIFSLLCAKKIKPKVAKSLSPSVRLLTANPMFMQMFRDTNQISLKDLQSVPMENCSLLTLPLVSSLISKGLLPLHVAKQIPLHLKPVFLKSDFSNYFTANTDWTTFCSLEKYHCNLLINCMYIPLFCQDKITLKQLKPFSASVTRMLIRTPHLAYEFEKTVDFADVIANDDINAFRARYALGYASRILTLIKKTPYRIDDKPNARQELIEELPSASDDCKLSTREFQNHICYYLICFIRYDIEKLNQATQDDNLKEIFSDFLALVSEEESDWATLCQNVIKTAALMHAKLLRQNFMNSDKHALDNQVTYTFKKPEPESLNMLLYFCKNTIEIADFIEHEPIRNLTRSKGPCL